MRENNTDQTKVHTKKAYVLKLKMQGLINLDAIDPISEGKMDKEICVAKNTYYEYLIEHRALLVGNPQFVEDLAEVDRPHAKDVYRSAMIPSYESQMASV